MRAARAGVTLVPPAVMGEAVAVPVRAAMAARGRAIMLESILSLFLEEEEVSVLEMMRIWW